MNDLQRSKGVFISYRRASSWGIAVVLREHLVRRGFDVFLDLESLDNGKFEKVIRREIRQRPHFLVVIDATTTFDDRAHGKDWMRSELALALALDRNIVPVLVDGVKIESVPLSPDVGGLVEYNSVPVYMEYLPAAVEKLVRFLEWESTSAVERHDADDGPLGLDTEVDPECWIELLDLAAVEERCGSVEAARDALLLVAESSDLDRVARAFFYLGMLAHQAGDQESALEWYGRALGPGRTSCWSRVRFNLAFLRWEREEFDVARWLLARLVEAGGPDLEAKSLARLAVMSSGRERQELLQRALETGHRDVTPLAMINLKMFAEAIALEHPHWTPFAMFQLACSLQDSGDIPGAEKWYGRAVLYEPSEYAYHAMNNLAVVRDRQSDRVASRYWAERLASVGSVGHSTDGMLQMARRLVGWNDPLEAREWLDRAVGTGFPRALVFAAELLEKLGDAAAAEAALRRASASDDRGWAEAARRRLTRPS